MRPFPRRTMLFIAVAVCLAQAVAIGTSVFTYEEVLSKGTRHLFKAAPVDPYDAFRGRYVALSQESLRFSVSKEEMESFKRGDEVWAQIVTEADGYSRFTGVSHASTGHSEVRTRVAWANPENDFESSQEVGPKKPATLRFYVQIEPPFPRFYMNEAKAPKAEKAYRKFAGVSAHVAVRVKDGRGVIEDLIVDGKPIDEWLDDAAKE